MGHTKSAVIALIFLLVVAWKVFAAIQALTPNANGAVVADGGTGHWATFGSGSSAWGRLDDNNQATGVNEVTVSDTCTFEFDDYTLPAGAVVSAVSVDYYACLNAGTSASMRLDNCNDATCTNGTANAMGPPELGLGNPCDGAWNQQFPNAPDGSSWDQTDINALRVRLILTAASGSGQARVEEIDVQVSYTIPPSVTRSLHSIVGQGRLHGKIKTRRH